MYQGTISRQDNQEQFNSLIKRFVPIYNPARDNYISDQTNNKNLGENIYSDTIDENDNQINIRLKGEQPNKIRDDKTSMSDVMQLNINSVNENNVAYMNNQDAVNEENNLDGINTDNINNTNNNKNMGNANIQDNEIRHNKIQGNKIKNVVYPFLSVDRQNNINSTQKIQSPFKKISMDDKNINFMSDIPRISKEQENIKVNRMITFFDKESIMIEGYDGKYTVNFVENGAKNPVILLIPSI